MLLPVAHRPGWLQDSETQELWIQTKLFCETRGITVKSFHTMKKKYRTLTLDGRIYVSWTRYQAQAKISLSDGTTRRLPTRNIAADLTTKAVPSLDVSLSAEEVMRRQVASGKTA